MTDCRCILAHLAEGGGLDPPGDVGTGAKYEMVKADIRRELQDQSTLAAAPGMIGDLSPDFPPIMSRVLG